MKMMRQPTASPNDVDVCICVGDNGTSNNSDPTSKPTRFPTQTPVSKLQTLQPIHAPRQQTPRFLMHMPPDLHIHLQHHHPCPPSDNYSHPTQRATLHPPPSPSQVNLLSSSAPLPLQTTGLASWLSPDSGMNKEMQCQIHGPSDDESNRTGKGRSNESSAAATTLPMTTTSTPAINNSEEDNQKFSLFMPRITQFTPRIRRWHQSRDSRGSTSSATGSDPVFTIETLASLPRSQGPSHTHSRTSRSCTPQLSPPGVSSLAAVAAAVRQQYSLSSSISAPLLYSSLSREASSVPSVPSGNRPGDSEVLVGRHRAGPILRDVSRSPIRVDVSETNPPFMQPSNAQVEIALPQEWFSSLSSIPAPCLNSHGRSLSVDATCHPPPSSSALALPTCIGVSPDSCSTATYSCSQSYPFSSSVAFAGPSSLHRPAPSSSHSSSSSLSPYSPSFSPITSAVTTQTESSTAPQQSSEAPYSVEFLSSTSASKPLLPLSTSVSTAIIPVITTASSFSSTGPASSTAAKSSCTHEPSHLIIPSPSLLPPPEISVSSPIAESFYIPTSTTSPHLLAAFWPSQQDTFSHSELYSNQTTPRPQLRGSSTPTLIHNQLRSAPADPLAHHRYRSQSPLYTLSIAAETTRQMQAQVQQKQQQPTPVGDPITASAGSGPLHSQVSNIKSTESSATSASSISGGPNDETAEDSINGSSASSHEAEPEPVAGFSYHHNPYPYRGGSVPLLGQDVRGSSTPNLVADDAAIRRHLTPSMQQNSSMMRSASTYSLASEYRGRSSGMGGTASPHVRNASASSRRSPDVGPQSYIEMLNTPYPQPSPAPISFDNSHLKHSVGTNASLLGTEKTLEMYRSNVKKTNDPSIQYSFAVFLISSAQEQVMTMSEAGSADPTMTSKDGKTSAHDLIREAKSILQKLSSSGYPFAQYYLADGYASGLFSKGKEDYSQAFPLFAMAAKHGHAESAYRAALCYEHGWGTRKDPVKALNFLRVAATKKHPGAMTRLGVSCLSGDLGERKYREGIKWLKLAAESADAIYPAAPYILGCLYETGDGEDIFQDPGYAAELFTQAADLGHAEANFRMGDAYEHGKLNCPKNPALSVHFYTGAAEKGNPAAMMGLCAWYIVGADPILEKDEEEAYEWAKRAADMGYTKAQYAVGYFTEMGIGCHRDILEANLWYVKAAEKGDERAKVRIAVIDAAIRGGKPSDASSVRGTSSSGGKVKKGGAPGKKDGECVMM